MTYERYTYTVDGHLRDHGRTCLGDCLRAGWFTMGALREAWERGDDPAACARIIAAVADRRRREAV